VTSRFPTLLALAMLASGVAHARPAQVATSVTIASNQPPVPGKRRIVGILDVKVEGVPPEIAAQFEKNLNAQNDQNRFWIAPQQRMRDMMANSTKWTDGCVIGKCLREVKTQTGADLVLIASRTGSGTSFGYVVTLVRTDNGRVLAQEAERCDVCTVNEALSAATAATVKILNAVPDELPDANAAADAQVALATRSLHEQLSHERHHGTLLGVSLASAGLIAGGVGALLYGQDHTAGVATIAAGAGVAAGGVVVLTF
jgi:hypothetical protein